MHRRFRIPLLTAVAALAVGLAACGDDSASTPATQPDTGSSLPPVDTSPDDGPAGIQHPTGVDDVVLRIGYEGGFVPVEYAFLDLPTLLVTGGGRVIVQGPVPAIYPGPLLPNMLQRTISEDGIQALLRLAEEQGLFRDVTYESDPTVADAPDTVVTLAANGVTYEHRAYALGLRGDGTETDPDREQLASFVAAATDIATAAGADTLGPEVAFAAQTYLIRATASEPSATEEGIEPAVVDWPADVAVRLADAADCAAVPVADVAELFASATQLTWFVDGGVTYQLVVKPLLPGVPSC